MPATRNLWTALAILVGLLLGVGATTAYQAKALSYLSNDPTVCVNCHIMQAEYRDWQKSSHHAVATCGDCHLPHDFIGKWLTKGLNGYHHSKGFTLQDFHEPIMIKPRNAQVLQDNCLRCHGDLVHDLVSIAYPDRPAQALRCVHCHATAGHGETAGLGGPERPSDLRGLDSPISK